jgi:hypothetical protein
MRLGLACRILLVAAVPAACTPVAPTRSTIQDNQSVAMLKTVDESASCASPASAKRVSQARAYVSRLESLLSDLRARQALGAASATEVAQVLTRLAEGRAQLARARADLAISRSELATATGQPEACTSIP